MYSGGEVGLLNGDPDARVWPRVEIIVIEAGVLVSADVSAQVRSDCEVGVPFMIVRFGEEVNSERDVGSRAKAVMV